MHQKTRRCGYVMEKTPGNKMLIVSLVYLLVAIPVIGQIVRLQFFSDYKDRLDQIVYRNVEVPAYRGSILGYDKGVLAISVPYYEVRMDCAVVSDSVFNRNIDGLCEQLAKLFQNKSANAYKQEISRARTEKKDGYRNLLIGNRTISYQELTELRKFPIFRLGQFSGGLITNSKDKRIYPYGRLAYRTIGYVADDDKVGVGIEYAYNSYLKGKPGLQRMRRRSGDDKWVPISNDPEREPKDGLDVLSTLDIDIQGVASEALQYQLGLDSLFEGGCAVVMEVETGAVRSIVNMKKKSDGTYDETYNYAIGESTNPGSTFKLATLICLLEDNYVRLTDSVETGRAGWPYYGHTFTESSGGYGTITVQQAFEKSSNVAFAKLAVEHYGTQEKKYINRLYNMKLNEKLNIELLGEGRASIPFPDDKTWSKLSLPMIAMGYEMGLTPLHTLTLYNAIANNGKLVAPYFIEGLMQHGQMVETMEHTPLSNSICSQSTLNAVRQALRGVVETGTAKRINDSRYQISGKTGTSQLALPGGGYRDAQGYRRHQASFVGFFPSDAPKYSMIVVLYSGKTRGNFYGATWAAPVFKQVADHIYSSHPFWNQPINN